MLLFIRYYAYAYGAPLLRRFSRYHDAASPPYAYEMPRIFLPLPFLMRDMLLLLMLLMHAASDMLCYAATPQP